MLIVDTVGFAPGVLSPPVLNSEKLHVVERFSLDTKDDADAQLHRRGSGLLQGAVRGLGCDSGRRSSVQPGPVQRAGLRRLLESRRRSRVDREPGLDWRRFGAIPRYRIGAASCAAAADVRPTLSAPVSCVRCGSTDVRGLDPARPDSGGANAAAAMACGDSTPQIRRRLLSARRRSPTTSARPWPPSSPQRCRSSSKTKCVVSEIRTAAACSRSVFGALWSSSAALVSIVRALNHAYDITEGRPWWKVRLWPSL